MMESTAALAKYSFILEFQLTLSVCCLATKAHHISTHCLSSRLVAKQQTKAHSNYVYTLLHNSSVRHMSSTTIFMMVLLLKRTTIFINL